MKPGCVSKEGMSVCFVNTEQPPAKIVRKGIFTYSYHADNKLRCYELCEVFYPHPDAPDCAFVSLLDFLPVECPKGFEHTATYPIDAVKGLSKVLIPAEWGKYVVQAD